MVCLILVICLLRFGVLIDLDVVGLFSLLLLRVFGCYS